MPTCPNRWLISGKLTTHAPMHIGDGRSYPAPRPEVPRSANKDHDEVVSVSTVCTDGKARPYVPGSCLKGALRAVASRAARNDALLAQYVDELFGSDDPAVPNSVGASAEFRDCPPVSFPQFQAPPGWTRMGTTIVTAVAIDRTTRTAAENKLFHLECVPAGAVFDVTIAGENLTNEEVSFLLHLLERFSDDESRLTLGAFTADGWGRCVWESSSVRTTTPELIAKWLDDPTRPYPMVAVDSGTLSISGPAGPWARPDRLSVELELEFDAGFLINGPFEAARRRAEWEKESTSVCRVTEDDKPADHVPRKLPDGRLVLPAKSLRGALRSQAERIIRSLGGHACHATDSDDACAAISAVRPHLQRPGVRAVADLCLACRLFGAPGWRTLLEVEDFTPEPGQEGKRLTQQFVAIDRFTGGAARKKLYAAEYYWQPTLSGTIRLDLNRAEPWMLGLLILLGRDLCEGDITFGFGAAKGYGTCSSRALSLPDVDRVCAWLAEGGVRVERSDVVPYLAQLFREHVMDGVPVA